MIGIDPLCFNIYGTNIRSVKLLSNFMLMYLPTSPYTFAYRTGKHLCAYLCLRRMCELAGFSLIAVFLTEWNNWIPLYLISKRRDNKLS